MFDTIIAAWDRACRFTFEALHADYRLRRLNREQSNLITWQKTERDALRRLYNETRAASFVLLSDAMKHCPPPLAMEISAFLPKLMPLSLIRPTISRGHTVVEVEEYGDPVGRPGWILPTDFDVGAKGTAVLTHQIKDPARLPS